MSAAPAPAVADASLPISVLVTGDVAWDHYLYVGLERQSGIRIRSESAQRILAGGTALLHTLLEKIPDRVQATLGLDLGKMGFSPIEMSPVAKLASMDMRKNPPGASGFSLMRLHREAARGDKKADEKAKVWRIGEKLGFDTSTNALQAEHANPAMVDRFFDAVVIDDAGMAFRRWPSRVVWPTFLLEGDAALPGWLVLKLSAPAAAGDLWHTLVSGETQDIEPKFVRDPHDLLQRTIGVLSVDDLRVESVHVSKPLSWERTALDLVHALQNHPSLAPLRKLRYLIVTFSTDGALLAHFPTEKVGDGDKPATPEFKLIFDPERLEGDFIDSYDGGLIGFQVCMTAAIVANLPIAGAEPVAAISKIEKGIITGLRAMRKLVTAGHGPAKEGEPGEFPFQAVAEVIHLPKQDEAKNAKKKDSDWIYGIARIPSGEPNPDWTIVGDSKTQTEAAPLWGLARRVALKGTDELTQTPYLKFGLLFSIERTEIESLRSLRRLFLEYRNNKKAQRPLSIAVFGPPGSGKSFGVKQLSKAVFGDDDPPLEFNLSQFQNPQELLGPFHQIRDKVLQGKLPIVFWDEFDSQNLKWLQFLLAPMQDGTFQQGEVTHPIGKCIFVFAGGTRHRFDDFDQYVDPEFIDAPTSKPNSPDESAPLPSTLVVPAGKSPQEEFKTNFRAMKGQDFASRLSGYLDVLGPNQRNSKKGKATPSDITFPVRRALLLRVQLGLEKNERLVIDEGLLSALLETREYRHGSRSVEKLAEQLRHLDGTKEFRRSDLPSRSFLDLYVDADDFFDLVEGRK